MRPVRQITAQEENFRTVPMFTHEEIAERPELGKMLTTKRDPVEPEPVGTIVLMAFRVTGYDPDCDGSLMARLEAIDNSGEATGWALSKLGLWPETGIVATAEEWKALFDTEPASTTESR